jgi:hypothetical protein
MNGSTIILALIGGGLVGGLITLIQFFVQRHDNRKGDLAAIKVELNSIRIDIKNLDKKGDRREAENRRVRILRFEDELQNNQRHSKDSFDQVMSDITAYNQYCQANPEFRNNQTEITASHITKVYHDCLEKHDFT